MSGIGELRSFLGIALVLLGAMGGTSSHAQSPFTSGELFFVHGLPGQELGLPNALPVDVTIGVAQPLTTVFANVEFGSFRGPLTLAQGVYQIGVSLANQNNPGTNPPVITGTVAIRPFQSFTFVANLSTAGLPQGTLFQNDTDRIALGRSRVTVRHAANAGPVDASLIALLQTPGVAALNLTNGTQSSSSDVLTGGYNFRLTAAGTPNLLLPQSRVFLTPGYASYFYVVGSPGGGTLQILQQNVPLRRKLLP